ncbi:MAG TPA: hypothetical protein PL182_08075, partial [Pseudobdellovibrionaceae bacterium]|nr:hypothetical protein [Pseudobdellovibrionaceae bacterium]
MFSFLVSLVFPVSIAFAADVCPVSSADHFKTASIEELGRHLRTRNMSEKTKAVEQRLARLNSAACQGKIWPDGKLLKSPTRVIDEDAKAVFQFDPQTNAMEFLREATPDDLSAPLYQFHKKDDGGITMHFRSPPKGPPPGQGGQNSAPTKRERLCDAEKGRHDDFLRTNIPKRRLDDNDGNMTTLAHESFHNVDQDPKNPVHTHTGACRWAHDGKDPDRTLSGDKDAIQLIRQHIMLNLKKSLDAKPKSSERTAALAQVKAWSTKLKKEFPEASKQLNDIDRGEGSAEYAGVLANIYGKIGCDADPEDFRKEFSKYLNDRYFPIPQSVDQQAYLLGSASGVLLDEMTKSDSWKKQVTLKEKSPLDLLVNDPSFKSVPDVAPEEDPTMTSAASLSKAVTQCLQGEAEKSVSAVLKNPNDYVLVELEKVQFGLSGSFSVDTPDGKVEVYTEASARANMSFE